MNMKALQLLLLGVNHDELVNLAEKHFSSLPSERDLPTLSPCRFTGCEVGVACDTTLAVSQIFGTSSTPAYEG